LSLLEVRNLQVTYGSGEVKDVSSGAFFFPCPAGLVPVGGDAYAVDAQEDIVPGAAIAEYFYANNSSVPNAWGATLGAGAENVDLIIEVICANASQATLTGAPAKSGGAQAAKPRE